MNPFHRTLSSLQADRGRVAAVTGAIGGVLIAMWIAWLYGGRVAVYRTSAHARLEVTPPPAQVAAPVSGRIVDVHLEISARVRAGDVLVVLDSTAQRIARERATAALSAIEPELASVDRELDAEEQAGRGGATSDREAQREALAQQRQVEVALEHAEEEETRTRVLVENGVLPDADLSRATMDVRRQRATLEALVHAASKRGAERHEREGTRRAAKEQLERQRAELESAVASARAEVEHLGHEVELRTLRAPLTGVLGQVASLRPGGVIDVGDVVTTVVPDGALQVVAEYLPDAIGRVAAGQRARVRLDGFPWTQYGTLLARVSRVGSELREGVIRVELEFARAGTHIPIIHGMTGVVEIEVESASPAELLARAVGVGR